MKKVQCRLKISIYKQIQHLLNLYPKTEWSGVGFYSKLNEDKHGWCTEWELVGFYPIDLGSTAATEFDGEDQLKMIQKAYKENPKLRECYKGLIHSHHTLGGGAFFSGTDRDHMKECANTVGYPSLVVAHESTKSPFAFSFSWLDSFQKVHWTKEKNGYVTIDYDECKPVGLFKKCLNSLEKQEKEQVKVMPTYYSRTGLMGQTAMFDERTVVNPSLKSKPKLKGSLQKEYDKLYLAYEKTSEEWFKVQYGSPRFELVEQQAIDAEAALDSFCNKNDINVDFDGGIIQ